MEVLVKRGISLPLFERSGSQSSFFVIRFHGWDCKSKVYEGNLNPKYNEIFCFPLGIAEINTVDTVAIMVESFKTNGKGRSLGTINHTLPIDDLRSGKLVRCTWPLLGSAGKPNGGFIEVELKANMAPHKDISEKTRRAKPINMTQLPKELDTYRLRFLVHKCTKLAHSPCSAITSIRFGESVMSTQIGELSQDPDFEEEINFVVNMSQADIAKEFVIIQVLNTLRCDEAAVVGEFKFMVETGFSGEPVGWNEPAYEPNTVCRSFMKKWMILTNPYQTPKNINGFVNMSFSVLQSGQNLTTSPTVEPIVLNVVQNVMRPSEVNSQHRKVYFRIYSAQELPVMDDEDIVEEKRGLTRQASCDPLVGISYYGVEAKTRVEFATYNPVFNTDIIFNIEQPAVTDTVVISLYDHDVAEDNLEAIATTYLSLTDISYQSDDEYGFEPTYGPTSMPLYGSPKHLGQGELSFPELNEGTGGFGYRGRLLFEVFTKPSYSVGVFAKVAPTPEASVKRTAKLMRTQKCVLAMGITEATMIPEEFGADTTIKFEISVGEFGYQDSMSTGLSNSQIFPKTPLFDSVKYYFIDYDVNQACIVPMEWECTFFRLEHLNILERIKEFYMNALNDIDADIQKEKNPVDIIYSMKTLMRKTILECNITLPDLPNFANELDRNLKKVREMKLNSIVKECRRLVRGSTLDGTTQSLKMLQTVLLTFDEICREQQNEIPNVLLYMFSGNKPVAYFSSPINRFLESSVANGNDCLKFMTMDLKPMDGNGNKDRLAAQLSGFIWFGTEEVYKNSFQFPFDGRISSYAETVRELLI